jgi:hypothetical protein
VECAWRSASSSRSAVCNMKNLRRSRPREIWGTMCKRRYLHCVFNVLKESGDMYRWRFVQICIQLSMRCGYRITGVFIAASCSSIVLALH